MTNYQSPTLSRCAQACTPPEGSVPCLQEPKVYPILIRPAHSHPVDVCSIQMHYYSPIYVWVSQVNSSLPP